MPNVKKDKLSKEEKLILKHKAIQLKNKTRAQNFFVEALQTCKNN